MSGPASARVEETILERKRIALLDGTENLPRHLASAAEVEFEPASADVLAAGICSGKFAAAILSARTAHANLATIAQGLAAQPAWSDFPFVLLACRGDSELALLTQKLGQVWIVERPIDPLILNQAIAAALRNRARQQPMFEQSDRHKRARTGVAHHASALAGDAGGRVADVRALNDQLLCEAEERRAAEIRLEESEELHRYTIELSEQIVWTTAPDGSDTRVGARFYAITGLPPGTAPREAVHPDDKVAAVKAWTDAIAASHPLSYDFRFVVRDGTARHFRARAAPRKDEHGRVLRWYGTFEDIHERKSSEQASADVQERYRLAARATNDVIWDLDLVRDEIQWSPTAARLFGLGVIRNPTSLKWWESRVHPGDRERVSSSVAQAIQGRRNRWSSSYRLKRTNGSYAEVLDRGFIIRDGAGRAQRMVGAISDYTELRQTQAEVQRMQAELIHVSRLGAMGALASTLAHELNQPLAAVTSYISGSRRLLEEYDEPAIGQVKTALKAAESGALRAGQIVRRVRELVARGNVAVRPELLPKLVEDACELAFVDERLHGVIHCIEAEEEVAWVEADRIQIQQVLINLVRNAVQAMAGRPRREILIATRASGRDFLEISVSDTGTGLPPERTRALFSPFQSTKEEGMGIGLSISRTIVEAHGGRIWAENNAEGGATFHFTLPRTDAPEIGDPLG